MQGSVAVLGATGFLGQAVVTRLLSAGRPVTMIARTPPAFVAPGAKFMVCDARDPGALAEALRDATQAVNATTGQPRTSVVVARNLAAWLATIRGPLPSLVHISSLAVFGQAAGFLVETTPPRPARFDAYARAKLHAEQLLSAAHATALNCAILRPGCVYGDGQTSWTHRLGRLLLASRLGWLGRAGHGRCQLIHVDDVARAVIAALEGGPGQAGIHHIASPDRLTWNELFVRFATHLGISDPRPFGPVRLTAESWLLAPPAWLQARLSGTAANVVTPSMLRLFGSQALPVCTRTALVSTGQFRPLELGLSEAAASLLQAGNVSTPQPAWPSCRAILG